MSLIGNNFKTQKTLVYKFVGLLKVNLLLILGFLYLKEGIKECASSSSTPSLSCTQEVHKASTRTR